MEGARTRLCVIFTAVLGLALPKIVGLIPGVPAFEDLFSAMYWIFWVLMASIFSVFVNSYFSRGLISSAILFTAVVAALSTLEGVGRGQMILYLITLMFSIAWVGRKMYDRRMTKRFTKFMPDG